MRLAVASRCQRPWPCGCGGGDGGDGALPRLLSQTGLFKDVARLIPAEDLLPYDVNVPFWSDGATKRRWIKLPPGTTMQPTDDHA